MTDLRPISAEGMEKLRQEWDELFREERPKLLIEIAAAAAQGDRSENAEYIYGKKRLREIDKRLRELDHKMDHCTVVSGSRRETASIVFGAKVRLKKADGKELQVQIVGVDEIDPMEGLISMDSPMGKALMGKEPKGQVEVLTPKGPMVYEIMGVEYS